MNKPVQHHKEEGWNHGGKAGQILCVTTQQVISYVLFILQKNDQQWCWFGPKDV